MNPAFESSPLFNECSPNSTKELTEVLHEPTAEELFVPSRRVHSSGGEPPFDIYDTSWRQGCNTRNGLPKLRTDWIRRRTQRRDKVFTQMHYARKGIITEENAVRGDA